MNEGQGPAGFSWGEALNLALPIAGLTAGLYAPHGSGQNIASFASLMMANQEREQKRKDEQAAQQAIARELGTDPSMTPSTQISLKNYQAQDAVRRQTLQDRRAMQQVYPKLTELRRQDRPLEERERLLQEYQGEHGFVPELSPVFERLLTQFAEERKRGTKAKEFGEGFMQTQNVPDPLTSGLIWDPGMLPPPPSTTVRAIPEPHRRGVERAQAYIRETGEEPTPTAQMTRYGLPEDAVVGGPEASADRRQKIAQAKTAEANVERRTTFTSTTLPQLESRLETLATTKGLAPEDVEAVRAVLDVAKDDPSPQNVRKAVDAIQALPKMVTQRKQFGERTAILNRRLDELRDRAGQEFKAGNLAKAEQNVRFMIQRIDAEVAHLKNEAEFADEATKRRATFEADRLHARRGQLFQWVEDVTRQRSETPGKDLPKPPEVPAPGSANPQGAAQDGAADALRKKGLLK